MKVEGVVSALDTGTIVFNDMTKQARARLRDPTSWLSLVMERDHTT